MAAKNRCLTAKCAASASSMQIFRPAWRGRKPNAPKQAEAEIETVDYTPEQIAALDPALFEPAGFNEEDAERRAIQLFLLGEHIQKFLAQQGRARADHCADRSAAVRISSTIFPGTA